MGRGKKRHPDWFLNATDTLLSLLDAKKREKCRLTPLLTGGSFENTEGL